MSERNSDSRRCPPTIRELAESRLARAASVDLEKLTQDEVRRFVHELEVHRVELEIQNQQLEEAQLETEDSRERFRQLYESAPIGFLTLDADGIIVRANACAAELFGVPRPELLGRKLSTFISERHQDRWHFARRALADGGQRRSLELALSLEDASQRDVVLSASGQPDSDGRINLGMLDLTELRDVERALRRAAAEVSLVEQHERRKLAADLHDDAGQLLSLASIKLRALTNATMPHRDREFAELSELLAEARRRITSLSFQLSPPLLHDVGLVAATRWLAEDLERSFGLKITVENVPELSLDEASRVTLFRAIRELLINVKKHAGCDAAQVRIWRDDTMVRVAIDDAGTGFDGDPCRAAVGRDLGRAGFGLLALQERLAQLGGTLEFGLGPQGTGSRVVASVPGTNDATGDSL
jgi:PAS domain S-box-containing protein